MPGLLWGRQEYNFGHTSCRNEVDGCTLSEEKERDVSQAGQRRNRDMSVSKAGEKRKRDVSQSRRREGRERRGLW